MHKKTINFRQSANKHLEERCKLLLLRIMYAIIGRRLAIGFLQNSEAASQMLIDSMPCGPRTGKTVRVDTNPILLSLRDFDICARVNLFEFLSKLNKEKQANVDQKKENDAEELMISGNDFLMRENELEMVG